MLRPSESVIFAQPQNEELEQWPSTELMRVKNYKQTLPHKVLYQSL